MNADLEKYLRRATQALPYQQRQLVREELHGSLMERAAEHELAGHAPAAALQLALQEFGDPAPLVRGMRRLYTVPRASLAALFLFGVAGLLLGVSTLRTGSSGLPALVAPHAPSFCPMSWWNLPARWRCERSVVSNRGVFRLTDWQHALEAQGVRTRMSNRTLYLQFPGEFSEERVPLSLLIRRADGEVLLDKYMLIRVLTDALHRPVRLSGTLNPTLTLGNISVQLGTPQAPLDVADLYLHETIGAALSELSPMLPLGTVLNFAVAGSVFDEPGTRLLPVAGKPGSVYALIDNWACVGQTKPKCGDFLLRVRSSTAGQLALGRGPVDPAFQVVRTAEKFVAMTQARRPAVLVWQVDTRDLQQLRLQTLPASGQTH